jgi:hypothetical protein
MRKENVVLVLETLGFTCFIIAFSFIVIGRLTEGFFLYIIGSAILFPFVVSIARKEHLSIRFLVSKLVEVFKSRFAKVFLIYFALFLSLLYFWFNKTLEHQALHAELWSVANVNTLWLRFLTIVFGGILILIGFISFPILILFTIKQIRRKRYASIFGLFLSIPSFLFVFFSGSQIAFQVWLLTTVISIFSWTAVRNGGLLKRISYIYKEIAATSLCVLIVTSSTSYVLPNPIYDQNYFTITDNYLAITDIWYTIDVRLRDIRSYAWETKWYKDWGNLAMSNKSFVNAMGSYNRFILELQGLESQLQKMDRSLHAVNFLTIWLKDVVKHGLQFDLVFISYARNEASFYVIYAKIFADGSKKEQQPVNLDEMYLCKQEAEKIFGIVKNMTDNTPRQIAFFYNNMLTFAEEFSVRVQYLNESYYEAKNFTEHS